ncbi:uncharacterized protein [Amphiura filiformis]|uniref:uncharacterized protein n=1 Tax=Amphiura filiformis TaxID=82378 RepID=UPI003B21353B
MMSVKAESQQQVDETTPPASQTQPVARTSKGFFGKIWAGISSVFHFLFWILSFVTYLNFVPFIWYFLCHVFRSRQLRKHAGYAHGEFVGYSATFPQWFGQLVRTEQANRRRLIKWVQEQIPARKIVDLNRSWSNGISLCALIETLVPDTCPRYDLLNPETRVNNCRLGMKLVQRGLGIKEPMAPEVMADPRRIQDDEMKRYLLSMQYASQTQIEIPEVPVKIPDAGGQIKLEEKSECTANGSGLVLAVVGKRARFNVATQTFKSKHLFVEICGPSGDRLRKKLVDIHGGIRGSGPARQSSKDEVVEGVDIVSFNYQFVKAGSYQINYIPRVVGIYEISITWGGEHINNSPYNIRAAVAKGAEPPPPFKTKTVSFQDDSGPVIPEAVPEEPSENDGQLPSHPGSLASKGRRQSLVRQSNVTKRGDSSESSGSGTLSALSSMSSSIAASVDKEGTDLQSHAPTHLHHQFSRQASSASRGSLLSRSSSVMYGAVDGPARVRTKRKVLRRIIKGAGGKEELIHYPQEQAKQKALSRETSKMTTGDKSSSRSASPRPPKSPTPPAAAPNKEKVMTKYGERMSKIILGRALYEVSKKMIMSSSNEQAKTKTVVDKTVKPKTEIAKNSNAVKNGQVKPKLVEPKTESQTLSPTPKITTSTLSADSNATLKEPGSKTGNKPLQQQNTQEFSPQISRDSDTSNSEREGPLGQEASEQSSGKRKGSGNNPFKKASITPAKNELKLLETVNRNGPDGQEKGEEEEPSNYKKLTASRSKSWEPKPSGSLLSSKNKKNVLQEHTKENIAPVTKVVKGLNENETSTSKWKEKTKTPKIKDSQLPNGESEKPVTLKVKRLPANRPRADKASQCTAQGIKDETGWISRRTIFQTKQKNDTDNDSALGESRGSSMLASNTDSRDVDVASWKSVEKDHKPLEVLEELLNSKPETFETTPFRSRIPSDSAFIIRQRSRSMTRQATFDSGYSDAQSHGVSLRSSRNHSTWNSRSASASSSHSALTPPGHDSKAHILIEQSQQRQTHLQNKPPIVTPVIEQAEVSEQSEGARSKSDTILTTAQDVAYILNAETSLSPKVSPHGTLTVGNALLISSTNPTPGGSPLPTPSQLSTPANSSNSNSPIGDSKVDMFTSVDTNNTSTSPIAGLSARDIGEKLVSGDMSLDTLLQSLEHDPDYSTREFLRKFRPASPRENTVESLQVSYDQSVLDREVGGLSPRPESFKSTNSVPLAERCRASGAGLFQGLVNTKNNFQVQTDNAGDGSLGVSIRGPQPHTVVESNVVYTGDDLYEVIYEVNLPGFYVVSVKWDDKHITDSPFIIKVTF